jgi:hypothetical protein
LEMWFESELELFSRPILSWFLRGTIF